MRRVLVLLLVTGCPEKAIDTNPVSDTEAENLCERGCSYDVDCLAANLDTCIADCVASSAGWVRHDALAAEQKCIADLACDLSPGTCGSRVKPLAIHRDFSAKCDAQLAMCSSLIASRDSLPASSAAEGRRGSIDCTVEFNHDDPAAGILRFAAPAIIDELSACLDGADCTARTDCITGVFDTYGI